MTDMKPYLLPLFALFASASIVSAQVANVITFTPSTLILTVGETKTVALSGMGPYYLGTNSNPAVAAATLGSNSSLSVSGYLDGTDSISVCSYTTTGVSCSSLGITVQKKVGTTPAQSTDPAVQTIAVDQSQVSMNIGETRNVRVTGTAKGSYYVSSVSNPEVVAANIVGGSDQVSLTAQSVGGSNISVCQFGGTCTNVYAYVAPTASNLQAAQTTKNPIPLLSAFYVASNDVGGAFLGKGAVLTIKFNTSDIVVAETMRVGMTNVQVNGAGSGPFAGTYTMNGTEEMPLPVYMTFTTSAGLTGHETMMIGSPSVPVATPTVGSIVSAFTRYLSNGSSNSEVTALQSLLKRLGIYAGPVTGNFGPLTEGAVKRYQALRGIDQAGYVGPSTRAALNKDAAK
jgi:hypothetical protein